MTHPVLHTAVHYSNFQLGVRCGSNVHFFEPVLLNIWLEMEWLVSTATDFD